jgi:hypothetical protein
MIFDIYIPGNNVIKYQFEFFAKHGVSIQIRNGKTYQINTKNAQKIKEEIEKRMLTTNNNIKI